MFLNEVQEGYMQYLGNVLIHIAYYGRKIKKNDWKLIEGGVVSDSLNQMGTLKNYGTHVCVWRLELKFKSELTWDQTFLAL